MLHGGKVTGEAEFLTAADAGRLVGLTPDGIRAAAARGDLRVAVRTPGGMSLYSRADVEAFKRARTKGRR